MIRLDLEQSKLSKELGQSCRDVSEDNILQPKHFETLGYFAGGIAHDFNNILSIIEGYTEIAIKHLGKAELTENHLLKVLTATERGAGITRQLLAFGQQNISINETLDLGTIIQEQERILRVILGEQIMLNISCPMSKFFIEGCKDNITQIITNLAVNARDAMNHKGHFSIYLEQPVTDNTMICLKVQDNGCGITDEILTKIFQPFFTTKESGQGTGLGLSFVHGVIEQMGGNIRVCSKYGMGTRFEIMFPTTDKKTYKKNKSFRMKETVPSQTLTGRTILIAEDEPDLRYVLEDMFDDMGMNVLSAGDGNEALLVQEDYKGHIDFLLTDVVMPEMHGVHLAELFQSLRPDAHVVFMSGYPSFGYKDRIHLPKDAILLPKPLRAENLSPVLQQCLAGIKKKKH